MAREGEWVKKRGLQGRAGGAGPRAGQRAQLTGIAEGRGNGGTGRAPHGRVRRARTTGRAWGWRLARTRAEWKIIIIKENSV